MLIRPKLNHAKSLEESTDNKLNTGTPPNTPVDPSILNSAEKDKPVLSIISATLNDRLAGQTGPQEATEDEVEGAKPRNSTDIIVCTGSCYR